MQNVPPINISEDDLKRMGTVIVQAFENDEAAKKLTEELWGTSDPPSLYMGNTEPQPDSRSQSSDLEAITKLLKDYGILDTKLGSPSEYIDVTQIHPLLRFENFATGMTEEVNRQAWGAMAPALALASKFLTTPELQSFWYRVAFATPVIQDGKKVLVRSALEDDPVKARVEFETLLMTLANKIRFLWSPTVVNKGSVIYGYCAKHVFAAIQVMNPDEGSLLEQRYAGQMQDPHFYESRIALTTLFLYHLLSPRSKVRNDDCTMMRLQFCVAEVLCHEIAHAVYQYRGLRLREVNPEAEAYIYPSDAMAEAGLSWSHYVFGEQPSAAFRLDLPGIDSHFICTSWQTLHSKPSVNCFVEMRWVEAWFRKDTWANIGHVTQNNLLRLPSPAGFPGPIFWYVCRFIADGSDGSGMYAILYREREVVYPPWAIGKVDGPPEGVTPYEWFSKISEQEKEAALADGAVTSEYFSGPQGAYEGKIQK